MALHIQPRAVLHAWAKGRQASTSVDSATRALSSAGGTDLAGLQATLTDAATTVGQVLTVVDAVIDETTANIDSCLAEYAASDGASAGRFHGLS
jgi:sirohydrochlorin ferrochelatase